MQIYVTGCVTDPFVRVNIVPCKALPLRIDLLVLMTSALLWGQVKLDLSTLAAFGFWSATDGRFWIDLTLPQLRYCNRRYEYATSRKRCWEQ